MSKWSVILATLAATILASSATAAPPIQVDFVKHATDRAKFLFAGSVSGDVTGSLTSRLVKAGAVTGAVHHITFDWMVSAGPKSFTARTTGIWNTNTGSVVMSGRVIAGYLIGVQVHEQGRLVDPNTLTFKGFLRLLPGTAP